MWVPFQPQQYTVFPVECIRNKWVHVIGDSLDMHFLRENDYGGSGPKRFIQLLGNRYTYYCFFQGQEVMDEQTLLSNNAYNKTCSRNVQSLVDRRSIS